nr:carboxypeptidase-like regulatory domain-containing protein [Chitinophagaceae bacterium]
MQLRQLLVFLVLFFCMNQVMAATLKGRITDVKGDPLPFASLYIKGTSSGTTSNVEGYYQFELSKGSHVMICQYVGFQKLQFEIVISDGVQIKNITLQTNEKALKEVVVKNGENLALAVIKKAIKKRSYYNKQIDAFKVNAYIKGNFKLDEIPENLGLLSMLGGGGSKEETKEDLEKSKGILMLSESVSEIYFKRPEKFKINVLSSRVSGNKNGYGFSEPIFLNLYDNNVEIGSQLTPRGLLSPIAETALISYKYELLSVYVEDGKLINRIKVIPRRKFEPLFSGIIDIIENEWRLHSVDLVADKDHQLEVVDTVKIKQVFVPVKDLLMVKDQSFVIKLKLMGFGITGNFVNVFSDYQLNYDESKAFNKYVKEYDEKALKRSIAYWDTIRPVPLNVEETADFIKKDSMEKAKPDTVAKEKNTVKSFVFRGLRKKITERSNISTTPIIGLNNFNWNTAEGFNYTYGINYRKKIGEDQRFSSRLMMRYGASNQQFNAKLAANYFFGKTNKSQVSVSGGRYVFQYNNEEPVNELINSAYTLLYGQNYFKFYQAWFGNVKYTFRHVNGLSITNQFKYQVRNPLFNTNLFSVRKNAISFTENFPVEKIVAMEPSHKAFIYKLSINYQPGRKYIKYPDRIVSTSSKYPTFGTSFTLGIPALGSDINYSKWNVEMQDDMRLNLWGTFSYKATVGGFLHNTKSYMADYTHFNGNQIILASPYMNSFQLSPYYLNSNTEPFYATLHAEHHFYGMITNKIPLFRRLKWYLVAATNTYYVNGNNNYVEASIGLENIGYKLLRFIRVDGVAGYTNFKNPVYGIRIGLNSSVISLGGGAGED